MTLAATVNLFMLLVVFILFIGIAVLVHLSNLKVKACEKSLNSINDDLTSSEEAIYDLLRFHGIE